MNPDIQIVFLKDQPNFVDEVAGLWNEEWGNESNENDRERKRLGCTRIYLRTEKADGYFSRLGWKMMHDTIDEKGLPTRVFSKNI